MPPRLATQARPDRSRSRGRYCSRRCSRDFLRADARDGSALSRSATNAALLQQGFLAHPVLDLTDADVKAKQHFRRELSEQRLVADGTTVGRQKIEEDFRQSRVRALAVV